MGFLSFLKPKTELIFSFNGDIFKIRINEKKLTIGKYVNSSNPDKIKGVVKARKKILIEDGPLSGGISVNHAILEKKGGFYFYTPLYTSSKVGQVHIEKGNSKILVHEAEVKLTLNSNISFTIFYPKKVRSQISREVISEYSLIN